jgi:peptidoglycan hydrolase-like protein with peptidoglycan-binding domain
MDEFRRWVEDARGDGVAEPKPPRQKKPDIKFGIGRVTVAQTINDFHPDVRRAQGLLSAYSPVSPGSVDGVAGPRFDRSVREFQTLKGLADDGVVGEETWRALEGAD